MVLYSTTESMKYHNFFLYNRGDMVPKFLPVYRKYTDYERSFLYFKVRASFVRAFLFFKWRF